MSEVPFSTCVERPSPPVLAELHLWRVQPSQASLRKIIRPSKGQKPIIMTGTRMSGRKVNEYGSILICGCDACGTRHILAAVAL